MAGGRALLCFGLPGLTNWQRVSRDADGARAIVLTDNFRIWAVDVALAARGPGGVCARRSDQSRRVRTDAHGQVDLGGETLRVIRSGGDGYVVVFSDEFADKLRSDGAAAETRIGKLLAADLDSERAGDFVAAWWRLHAGDQEPKHVADDPVVEG